MGYMICSADPVCIVCVCVCVCVCVHVHVHACVHACLSVSVHTLGMFCVLRLCACVVGSMCFFARLLIAGVSL